MNEENSKNVKKVAVVLYYLMFIYSGFSKILNFNKKVEILGKKTYLPYIINVIGMIGVIILEIAGSLILILDKTNLVNIYKNIISFIYILFLLFLIVVTALYHPPNRKKIIPFLSNITHFSGLLYLFADI